jgi:hypothetical protein
VDNDPGHQLGGICPDRLPPVSGLTRSHRHKNGVPRAGHPPVPTGLPDAIHTSQRRHSADREALAGESTCQGLKTLGAQPASRQRHGKEQVAGWFSTRASRIGRDGHVRGSADQVARNDASADGGGGAHRCPLNRLTPTSISPPARTLTPPFTVELPIPAHANEREQRPQPAAARRRVTGRPAVSRADARLTPHGRPERPIRDTAQAIKLRRIADHNGGYLRAVRRLFDYIQRRSLVGEVAFGPRQRCLARNHPA